MRHHVPRWIIGFYYPFPCTLDMGPTGVIPGSHLLSNGPYNDGGWSQAELSDAELEHCGGDPAAEHDAKLAAAASALYPGAVERKTAVGDLCHPESGTLFLLNFGILHRRCTRLPGSLWRNMCVRQTPKRLRYPPRLLVQLTHAPCTHALPFMSRFVPRPLRCMPFDNG